MSRDLLWSALFHFACFSVVFFSLCNVQNESSLEIIESRSIISSGSLLDYQYQPDPSLQAIRATNFGNTKLKIDNILKRIQSSKFSNDTSEGRGIIIVGYDHNIIETLALVDYIRAYDETPIQVYFVNDLRTDFQTLLQKYSNVELVNLFGHELFEKREGYQFFIKLLAMIATNFKEVLYLDGDCFPLFHITKDLMNKSFQHLGKSDMLFFRDLWMHRPESAIFKYMNMPFAFQRQIDSGVIIYRKNSRVLLHLLCTYYMSLDPHFDSYSWGDKDLFWFASLVIKDRDIARTKVLMIPTSMGTFGTEACGYGMLHFLDDLPSFAHGCALKHKIGLNQCTMGNATEAVYKHSLDQYILPKSKRQDYFDDYSQVYHGYNGCVTVEPLNGPNRVEIFDGKPLQKHLVFSATTLQAYC
eukprot:NODE_1001_length_2737_cov_0.926080.p1 type:complete len:414 gc:universal NODE_1001_length_2737_cov_0.926080:2061-820(-)